MIVAQDKRSAVLGKGQYTSRSPVGTVRNRYPEHVSVQSTICNSHGKHLLSELGFWDQSDVVFVASISHTAPLRKVIATSFETEKSCLRITR